MQAKIMKRMFGSSPSSNLSEKKLYHTAFRRLWQTMKLTVLAINFFAHGAVVCFGGDEFTIPTNYWIMASRMKWLHNETVRLDLD